MKDQKNNNEEEYVRCRYDKGDEDTYYEAENHFNVDNPWTPETSIYENQPSETGAVDEITENDCSDLTVYRTKRNPIREFYQKVLCNERFFHGYLPLQDARELLKYKPRGHFVVHTTNECGFLNPVVLSVKHYSEVVHHVLNVGVMGKCFTTNRMFDSVSHIIAHYVQSGEYIDDRINFRLITAANFCDWQIRTENVLTIKQDIGKGCFSNVSFGFHVDKGKFIEAAIKCPKEVAEVDTVGMMYTEHRLLQQLDCPYIIKPFGITVFAEIPMMVMEYANGGSLENYLKKNTVKIKRKMKFCLQIASALQYLKRKELIHRDIAARNCLVFKGSDKITAKLSDFNLCKEIYEEEERSPCISLRWSAPESLGDNLWSYESDLWMFGVLMWEIFTNALYPHNKDSFENTEEFRSYLMEGNTLEMLPEIPAAIQTIILQLHSINPAKRGNVATVLKELKALLSIDDTCLLLRIQSNMDKPVARVKPMRKDQPAQTEVVDALTGNGCSHLTPCRSKAHNQMREFYRKQLANESYFHGYMTEKDAREILKYKPNGWFLVHTTNERGVLKPVVLSVKYNGEVVHHVLNVGLLGKCFGRIRVFDSVPEMIAHHMQSGEFIDDKIKFQLTTAANFSDWQIKTEKAVIIREDIAQGSFSNVSFGFYIHNSKYNEAAIKCPIDVPWVDTVGMMYTEHRLLQQLDCPYIVKPFGITVFTEVPMMVMEYASGGSLDNCLKRSSFKVNRKIEFCFQIASALQYLKRKKLIHRDIAARNCLLFRGFEKLTVKLSDFNLCKAESEVEKDLPSIPLHWSAPESLGASLWSYESDLWMFGVLMWEIFTNALHPHDNVDIEDTEEFCTYLMEGNTLEMLPEIPAAIQTIILQLHSINPAKRGNVATVLKELKALL
ncbi:Tyrosine-protein kinase transforming protein Fps, partial [Trichinella zimbabwensis]